MHLLAFGWDHTAGIYIHYWIVTLDLIMVIILATETDCVAYCERV